MNRRRALAGLLTFSTSFTSLRTIAQVTKNERRYRITTLPDFWPEVLGWFLDAMRDLGWTEGRDFEVVQSGFRIGELEFDEAAKRAVADMPDLIVASGTASTLAAHRATKTIPIVMSVSGYPVEAGVAESLAKPGKNVTGNTVYAGTEIWGKLLQLLLHAKPGTRSITVLWTYVPPAVPKEEIEPCIAELRNAERTLGVQLHIVEIARPDQVSSALAHIDAVRPDALLITGGLPGNVRSTLMHAAVDNRLPTITDLWWPITIEPYPLITYAPETRALVRTSALSIDKILRGAKPSDVPIQQPAKFEMQVNLKTAKLIGLTIPQELLLSADKVIE